MGEFIVEAVKLKKGEEGIQNFIIFESDGTTRRDGTGKSYNFAAWKPEGTINKMSGALVADSEIQGEWHYVVKPADTDTIDEYEGELIEDPTGTKIRSETFPVSVERSSDHT